MSDETSLRGGPGRNGGCAGCAALSATTPRSRSSAGYAGCCVLSRARSYGYVRSLRPCLAACLILHVLRRLLGRDERGAQERLELAEADEVGLELLDLVGEVGPLAPDVLEAHHDVLEELVDRACAIATEPGPWRLDVSD